MNDTESQMSDASRSHRDHSWKVYPRLRTSCLPCAFRGAHPYPWIHPSRPTAKVTTVWVGNCEASLRTADQTPLACHLNIASCNSVSKYKLRVISILHELNS